MNEPVYSSCLDTDQVIRLTTEKLKPPSELKTGIFPQGTHDKDEAEAEADLYFNRKR